MRRLIPLALCLAGCSGATSWFPVRDGAQWKYLVRQGGAAYTVRAIERTRVGEAMGWKLDGDAGASKVAWTKGELVASQLTATQFSPPIPILRPSEQKSSWKWSGVATFRAKPSKASATIEQEPTKLRFGGVERQTLRVKLTMMRDKTQIELITWYEEGVGVLQQEQRNNGELVASLVLTGSR